MSLTSRPSGAGDFRQAAALSGSTEMQVDADLETATNQEFKMTEQQYASLQELLDAILNLVTYFHGNAVSPHSSGRPGSVPIPAEFTNWRDEQRAWRESVLMMDFSHHMPELFLRGRDALKLLSDLGINSFASFPALRAKQYFCCNHEGYIIGESVLQHLDDGTFELISGEFTQNWVAYNAQAGGYDVTVERDPATPQNSRGRRFYRFQLEGPNARDVFAEAIEGEMPDIAFFHMAKVKIAGCEVYVLRHGMAGNLGVELSGPYAEGDKVRARLIEAGEKFEMKLGGLKAQFSALGESGWLPYPMPAIYSSPELAAYRRWLPADGWEARTQLGGSYVQSDIEDYYVTPWDLGVDKRMKFDHDFVGRAALERLAGRTDHRKKVTLVWDDDDIVRVQRSLLEPGIPFKYLEMPKSSYGFQHYDEIRSSAGDLVGFSKYVGYTVNEAKFLSVAVIDPAYATPGAEVYVTWGEPETGARKPGVELHRQTQIKAVVAPNPYAAAARKSKNAAMVKLPA